MNSANPYPVTLEVYNSLPYEEIKRVEVIDGQIAPLLPHVVLDGIVAARIMFSLGEWGQKSSDFESLGRCGYLLQTEPLVILAPSSSVVNKSEVARNRGLDRYWMGVPVVAVEMVPEDEKTAVLPDKVRRYLAAGTSLVLAVHPHQQRIEAYLGNGDVRDFLPGDVLVFTEVLPNFSCPVDMVFAKSWE